MDVVLKSIFMKKFFAILFIILLVAAAAGAWIFLGSATGFATKKETLYISSNAANKNAVLDSLTANKIISNKTAFNFLANRMNYWQNIKPGKYEIEKGTSLLSIMRLLRNGRQTPVNLVITKLRTKEDFAKLTGSKFEFDSTAMIMFLANADSLKKFGVDTTNAMSIVLPDTYTYFWNTTPHRVLQKLFDASTKFWTEERKQKAAAQNLSPTQVHTLASIIEEETTNHAEKDTIASVYLNRLKTGMPLQADPTLKFAVRNFALKRIAGDILNVQSPYNTYWVKGLPPGPISTPSKITIDKVLNPATTNFLYFVAKPRLGGHLFSVTYEEHLRKRDDYLAADKQRRDTAQ